ncbi:hypothetical protein HDU76_005442 [Blyttiomyces sp. JEL0837]|nr:hypothetical protein HDU76_005442 [Blyttiomyces sp. JEL0837]
MAESDPESGIILTPAILSTRVTFKKFTSADDDRDNANKVPVKKQQQSKSDGDSQSKSNLTLMDATAGNCAKMSIRSIDDISPAISLRKLDLSNNRLSNPDSLAGLADCRSLTWLNLSGNQLESLEGLQGLRALNVLNLSHNKLTRISIHVSKLTKLKALILNNNEIIRIDNLSKCTHLNTLASNNNIHAFPDLTPLVNLKELRVAHNKITVIPDTIRYLSELEILDIGNNLITSFQDVSPLGSLMALDQLNLRGNALTEKPGYREAMLKLVTTLRVFDGDRFDAKFLERKEKRKQWLSSKAEGAHRMDVDESDNNDRSGHKNARTTKSGIKEKSGNTRKSQNNNSKHYESSKPTRKPGVDKGHGVTGALLRGQGPRPLHVLVADQDDDSMDSSLTNKLNRGQSNSASDKASGQKRKAKVFGRETAEKRHKPNSKFEGDAFFVSDDAAVNSKDNKKRELSSKSKVAPYSARERRERGPLERPERSLSGQTKTKDRKKSQPRNTERKATDPLQNKPQLQKQPPKAQDQEAKIVADVGTRLPEVSAASKPAVASSAPAAAPKVEDMTFHNRSGVVAVIEAKPTGKSAAARGKVSAFDPLALTAPASRGGVGTGLAPSWD